jgi:uncharacterized phage protein (TIGR02218 family)
MPATIPAAFETHIQGDTTTLAVCCRVTRKDGAIFGFTNHAFDLTIDALMYRAGSGMTPSAMQEKQGMEVDNAEIEWLFQHETVSERDVRAGLFDNARVEFFIINYNDLAGGYLKGPVGNLGRVKMTESGSCSIEFRSLSQKTTQQVLEQQSETCRAKRVGDARCKFDMNGNTADGYPARTNAWVTAVTNRRQFTSNLNTGEADAATRAADYSWETATFNRNLSQGSNYYATPPIQSFDGDRVVLSVNANIENELVVGDTGTLQSVRLIDAVPVEWNFEVISVRQEASGEWSFQVKSDMWGAIPAGDGTASVEVMSWAAGMFTLQEPLPFDIEASDEFVAEVGCDRSRTMCRTRFANVINFVGEPDIKPIESVLEIERQ